MIETRKESFIFYSDWTEILLEQPDEIRLELFDAIVNYASYGKEISLSASAKLAFQFVKKTLDKDSEKWEVSKNKRVEAGRKGGKAKQANTSNAKQDVANLAMLSTASNASNAKQCLAKQAVYVNVNDSVNVIEKEKEKKEKTKGFEKPTIEEVAAVIAEKGYHFSAEAFVGFYESNGWKVGKNPMKSWKGALVTWENKYKNDFHANTNNDKDRRRSTEVTAKSWKDYEEPF